MTLQTKIGRSGDSGFVAQWARMIGLRIVVSFWKAVVVPDTNMDFESCMNYENDGGDTVGADRQQEYTFGNRVVGRREQGGTREGATAEGLMCVSSAAIRHGSCLPYANPLVGFNNTHSRSTHSNCKYNSPLLDLLTTDPDWPAAS